LPRAFLFTRAEWAHVIQQEDQGKKLKAGNGVRNRQCSQGEAVTGLAMMQHWYGSDTCLHRAATVPLEKRSIGHCFQRQGFSVPDQAKTFQKLLNIPESLFFLLRLARVNSQGPAQTLGPSFEIPLVQSNGESLKAAMQIK
jgi:hypothetical protein